jgi:glycosyltransferase involved in cell wall biosynthesis
MSMLKMGKKQPTIGLALIVKNEESRIGGCLDSVRDLDELKVLDTGSTDRTGDVVREHGGKFIEGRYVWNRNYAEARNVSLRLCTTDWILVMGAGERLDPGGVHELRRSIAIIAEGYPETDGGDVLMYNVGKPTDAFPSTRLLRNRQDIFFDPKYRIHECPNVQKKADLRDVVKIGFKPRPQGEGDYNERIGIIEDMLRDDPHDLRLQYIAGREYFVNGFLPNAVYWLERYIRTRTLKGIWNERTELADVYFTVGWATANMHEWEEAKRYMALALTVNADFREAAQALAQIALQDKGDPNNELNAGRWTFISESAQNRKLGFKSKGLY